MNLPASPGADREAPEYGEVRVRLPFRLYVGLHSMKLLSGRRLSDIMTAALEAYLAQEARERAARPARRGEA